MSTTIDQRIVEMRFDNKHFEQNVSGTMSTLDKLKSKLNLSGASKAFDGLKNTASNVQGTFKELEYNACQAGFSFRDVWLKTSQIFEYQIANRVVSSAKNMVKALTIDPIKTGFSEYETQLNSVQTILANTSSKGSTLDDVNGALDELNAYADKTIYNFTEMTRNIGTFTAAGVDLETSVSAIQGIANLAAVSGSTSQQASTAMYQLSQALAAGKVSLMDWNSVVNAGMGGQVFQDALIRTSEMLGTGAKAAIDASGSFRESLTKTGWLTKEVLTTTLDQFTMAAKEGSKEWNAFKKELMEKGYTEEQATEILKMANTATDAATKVKTLTQLWDVMKEAAQSGWAQTWEIIVGDFEEAKALFTPIADFFTTMIGKFSDFRNDILESALGRTFSGILDSINKVSKPLGEVVGTLMDYEKVVTEIIQGKWGNTEKRWNALEKAGYDWKHAQNLVNERLGNSLRRETDYAEQNTKALEDNAEATVTITKANAEYIASLTKKTDAQLKELGYNTVQINSIRVLQKLSEQTGLSVVDLVQNLDKLNGRWLMIEGFKNIGQALVKTFSSIGDAWKEMFPELNVKNIADGLFNLIASFHKMTLQLEVTDERADKIKRTFKGLFAIVDILATVMGGVLKFAFKAFSTILKVVYNTDLIGFTACIGDAIVAFHDWLESTLDLTKAIEFLAPYIRIVGETISKWFVGVAGKVSPHLNKIKEAISGWWDGLLEGGRTPEETAQYIADGFSKAISYIGSVFDALKDLVVSKVSEIGSNVADGLGLGILSKAKYVFQVIAELGRMLLEKLCDVLGVQSPSWKTFNIGSDTLQGLINALIEMAPVVWDKIKEIGSKMISYLTDTLKDFDLGTAFSLGFTVAVIKSLKTIGGLLTSFTGILKNITAPIGAIAPMFVGVGATLTSFSEVLSKSAGAIKKVIKSSAKVVKSFAKVLKSFAFSIKAKAMKDIAISLLILVGAFAILTLLDPTKLKTAVEVILILAGVLVLVAWACDQMGSSAASIKKGEINLSGLKQSMVSIGAAILLIALAAKLLGNMSPEQMTLGFIGLAGIVIAIGAVLSSFALLAVLGGDKHIKDFGKMLTKLSVALLLLVVVVKLIGGLDAEEMFKGYLFIGTFVSFVMGLTLVSAFAGEHVSKIGGMMIKLAIAMALMVGVVKLVNLLSWEEMIKGAVGILGFVGIVGALVLITNLAGNNMPKITGLLLAMSVCMLVMTGVVKLIGNMSWGELAKGLIGVGVFTLLIGYLVASISIVGNNAPKIALALISISIALGVMAAICVIMSLMSPAAMAKGLTIVTILSLLVAELIRACRNVGPDLSSSLTAIAICIGVLAAAVAIFAFIPIEKLAPATVAMTLLMYSLSSMIQSTRVIAKEQKSLYIMLGMVALIGGIVIALSYMNGDAALKGAIGVSAIMLAMSGALFIISKSGTNVNNAWKGILALTLMAVPLLAFVGILYAMKGLDVAEKNVLILVGLTAAMTLLLIPLGWIGSTMGFPALIGVLALTAMAVPLLAFVGILYAMKGLDIAEKNVLILVGLMTAMTLLLIPLTLLGMGALAGIAGVVALTSMALPLYVFAQVISKIPDIAKSQANVILLTELMKQMTLLLIPLTLIGFLAIGAFAGIVALTAMVIPMSVFALALSVLPDITKSIQTISILCSVMAIMTNLLLLLAPVAPLAAIAVVALTGLTALMVAVGGLATVIGYLNGDSGELEEFLDNGIGLLNKICYAIGSFMGNLIAGFSETVMAIIPKLGTALSDFMTNVTPFLDTARTIDESVLTGVGYITGAILALTVAEFVNGMASFVGLDLASLGTELSNFMINATPFLVGAMMIDESTATGIGCLAEAIITLTAADLINGLSLFGGTSLADFGAEIAAFGPCIKSFADSVSTIGPSSIEKMKTSAEAGKILAEMAKDLPNSGGLLGKIFGENDMDTFGLQLAAFGASLVLYALEVSTLTDEDVAAIKRSIDAAKGITEVADAIPNTGGFLSKVAGDNDMATFGKHLQTFGSCLKSYGSNVANLNIDAIKNSVKPAKDMVKVADTIPNTGGFLAKITGDNDIATFGEKMKEFGTALVDYSDTVSDIDATAIFNSKTTATTLIGLIGRLEGVEPDNAKNFKPKPIGDGLKDYYDKISGVNMDTLASSVTTVNKLITLFNNMKFIDGSGVDKFKSAVSNLGSTSFEGLTSSFSGAASRFTSIGSDLVNALSKGVLSKSSSISSSVNQIVGNTVKTVTSKNKDFKMAGSALINSLVVGIKLKVSNVTTAMKTPLNSAVSTIRNYYTKFKSAGSYVVDGFCKGINVNTWKAEAEARIMAQAAIDAAKAKLQQNSPSKVFIDIGAGVVEGFVKGIDDNVSSARTSVINMAKESTSSFKNAIGKVSSIISGDVELDPVIRPVLDMSDVESGVNSINTMFSKNPTFGASANLNAINTMMNRRNQNGVNSDVVEAIDKLGKELGNVERTTYTINGVTYTEGDSVTDAIRTIVRAATREGRA